MGQRKLYYLSDEAIEKLQIIAERNNMSNSKMLDTLIMLAYENNFKVKISHKTEYKLLSSNADYLKMLDKSISEAETGGFIVNDIEGCEK